MIYLFIHRVILGPELTALASPASACITLVECVLNALDCILRRCTVNYFTFHSNLHEKLQSAPVWQMPCSRPKQVKTHLNWSK
jgi:hypothetical protein